MSGDDIDMSALRVLVQNNKERLDKLDIIIEKLRTRLPVWATVIGAIMAGVIGYLLK